MYFWRIVHKNYHQYAIASAISPNRLPSQVTSATTGKEWVVKVTGKCAVTVTVVTWLGGAVIAISAGSSCPPATERKRK